MFGLVSGFVSESGSRSGSVSGSRLVRIWVVLGWFVSDSYSLSKCGIYYIRPRVDPGVPTIPMARNME